MIKLGERVAVVPDGHGRMWDVFEAKVNEDTSPVALFESEGEQRVFAGYQKVGYHGDPASPHLAERAEATLRRLLRLARPVHSLHAGAD